MIQTIMNYFLFDITGLPYTRIKSVQEFSQTSMTLMGYNWNDSIKSYNFIKKGTGKIIHNYDEPNEFLIDGGDEAEEQEPENVLEDHEMLDTPMPMDPNREYVPPP